MIKDPCFWALVVAFALIFLGLSPLFRVDANRFNSGCLLIALGIVTVLAVTAVKVLA